MSIDREGLAKTLRELARTSTKNAYHEKDHVSSAWHRGRAEGLRAAARVVRAEPKKTPEQIAEEKRTAQRYHERHEIGIAVKVAGPGIDSIRREARARIETLTDEVIDATIEELLEDGACYRGHDWGDSSLVFWGTP